MLESLTLGQIITAIGGLAVIAGFFTGIFKWYKSHITDEFAKLNNKIQILEELLLKFFIYVYYKIKGRIIMRLSQLNYDEL